MKMPFRLLAGWLLVAALSAQTPRETIQRNVGTNTLTGTASGAPLKVATIAALKAVAVSRMENAQQVEVTGHTTAGDGGGGIFQYTEASGATDNGGTILQPTSGSGRWLRVYSGPARLEWFGGFPSTAAGTGADCSTAFIAAIGAAAAVELQAGHYRLNSKVSRNTSNCQIAGLGKDVSYLDWYGAGTCLESYSQFGVTPSLGYIVWRDFTLTDFGTGTTKGFRLGLFTKGCSVARVKIVNFDYGLDVDNVYYSTLQHVDVEGCGVGLQFTDRCNDWEILDCTFTTGAVPAATNWHVLSNPTLTANSHTVVFRDCSFDGKGALGSIKVTGVFNLVIEGAYIEVYPGDSGLSTTVIDLGANMESAKIVNNEMIGPDTGVFTGKWIHASSASSRFHTIRGNRQYRASGATFLTTTTGSTGTSYKNNYTDCADGTIPAGTVNIRQVAVYMPATSGTGDFYVPCFKTTDIYPAVRVLFSPMAAVNMAGRSFRVNRKDDDSNVLIHEFNDTPGGASLAAMAVVNCGTINGMAADVLLYCFIDKDGGSFTSPHATVIFEYYD